LLKNEWICRFPKLKKSLHFQRLYSNFAEIILEKNRNRRKSDAFKGMWLCVTDMVIKCAEVQDFVRNKVSRRFARAVRCAAVQVQVVRENEPVSLSKRVSVKAKTAREGMKRQAGSTDVSLMVLRVCG
jgi:hypothetical protein